MRTNSLYIHARTAKEKAQEREPFLRGFKSRDPRSIFALRRDLQLQSVKLIPKKSAGKCIRKFIMGIVLSHQLKEVIEMRTVYVMHVALGETRAKLAEMGTCTDIFYLGFCSCVVWCETARVITDQIDPRRAAVTSGSDQCAVMTCRGKANL